MKTHATCLIKCTTDVFFIYWLQSSSIYSFSMDLQDFLIRARVFKLYRQALRVAGRAPPPARGKLPHFISIFLVRIMIIDCLLNDYSVQVNWDKWLDKRWKIIETAMTSKGSVTWLVKAWKNWNASMKCLICKVIRSPLNMYVSLCNNNIKWILFMFFLFFSSC